jgi:hypothetical protein
VYFSSFRLLFLKSGDGRTFEDKISADESNFIFPVFQVLIFSDLKSSFVFFLLIPSHHKNSIKRGLKSHLQSRAMLSCKTFFLVINHHASFEEQVKVSYNYH